MKQLIRHNSHVDIPSLDEIAQVIEALRPVADRTIRASAVVGISAAGAGAVDPVYQVPIGMEFFLQRVMLSNLGATYAACANGAASIAITRSGVTCAYLNPQASGGGAIPGEQDWSLGQGPFFRNGESIGIVFTNLTTTPAATGFECLVEVQGILRPPAVMR